MLTALETAAACVDWVLSHTRPSEAVARAGRYWPVDPSPTHAAAAVQDLAANATAAADLFRQHTKTSTRAAVDRPEPPASHPVAGSGHPDSSAPENQPLTSGAGADDQRIASQLDQLYPRK